MPMVGHPDSKGQASVPLVTVELSHGPFCHIPPVEVQPHSRGRGAKLHLLQEGVCILAPHARACVRLQPAYPCVKARGLRRQAGWHVYC